MEQAALLSEPQAAASIAALIAGVVKGDAREPTLSIGGYLLASVPEDELASDPETMGKIASAIASLVVAGKPQEKPPVELLNTVDAARESFASESVDLVSISSGILGTVLGKASSALAGGTLAAREALMRGWYGVSAFKRVRAAPGARGKLQALRKEPQYYKQHLEAAQRRVASAEAVQAMAKMHGDILGWQATIDARTDAICLNADHKNFSASNPPAAGLPGSIHPHCRCVARPPWPGAQMLA